MAVVGVEVVSDIARDAGSLIGALGARRHAVDARGSREVVAHHTLGAGCAINTGQTSRWADRAGVDVEVVPTYAAGAVAA